MSKPLAEPLPEEQTRRWAELCTKRMCVEDRDNPLPPDEQAELDKLHARVLAHMAECDAERELREEAQKFEQHCRKMGRSK